MQKTIIYQLVNNKGQVDINDSDLSFFDDTFKKWYMSIKQAKEYEWEVNLENVITAGLTKNYRLDENYPKDEHPFISNPEVLVKGYLESAKNKKKADTIKRLADEWEKTHDQSILEQIARLTRNSKKLDVDVVPIEDYKSKQIEFIERVRNKIPQDGLYLYRKGFTEQFRQLSKVLNVIAPSDLVIIAGRPSVGKTSFALSLAHVLCKNGYRGLFFSMEMTNEQLLNRLAMAKSGVPNKRIFSEEVEDGALTQYLKGLDEVSKIPLFVVDNIPHKWSEMKQLIKQYSDSIDFVMIDYIGLISSFDGNDGNQPKHVVYSNISRDMKLLAKELGKPIISLAQFNRNVGSENTKGGRDDDRYSEPYMRDLRDTGSLEQDADKMIFLYRQKESKEDREYHEKSGIYNTVVKIEKNRAGSTTKLPYKFNGALQRWEEVKENGEK